MQIKLNYIKWLIQFLKYLLEYDTKKGTYRIKSTVVKALQTPGAILEFDEINTLEPEVAKSLNSLFDHDRTLYLGEDGEKEKAEEEVIIVGLQNPQHYMGVKPLAETIKSRARIMEVEYPPLEEKSGESVKYRPDEAMIVRQSISELRDLTDEDFQILWDKVKNKKDNPRVTNIMTPVREEAIKQIFEIILIANKIREAYGSYRKGETDDPITFTFSLREAIECGYEIEDVVLTKEEKGRGITKAKKAVQEVVLPKIPQGEERIYLQTLISQI